MFLSIVTIAGPSPAGRPVVPGPPIYNMFPLLHVWPSSCCIHLILYLKMCPPLIFGPPCCEFLATGLNDHLQAIPVPWQKPCEQGNNSHKHNIPSCAEPQKLSRRSLAELKSAMKVRTCFFVWGPNRSEFGTVKRQLQYQAFHKALSYLMVNNRPLTKARKTARHCRTPMKSSIVIVICVTNDIIVLLLY